MSAPFIVEPLADHDLSQFDSGVAQEVQWLLKDASSEMAARRRATFVAVDRANGRVSGAYALAIRLVHLQGLYLYRQHMVKTYPYVRVAVINHLHIDTKTGSPTLGAAMLVNALYRIRRQSEDVRMVILETRQPSHATAFQSYGFVPDPHDPMRLFGRLPW